VGRANLDGTPVEDNPYFDGSGPNNDYIWARGFRNPFTMTFQPATGLLWLNVVGSGYEQVFVVRRGDHGGWATYENNQPAGFITPIIKYRTNSVLDVPIAPADQMGAARAGGVTTFNTTSPTWFRTGEKIVVSGVADGSFNGEFFVTSAPAPSTFTVAQPGPDATSGGGITTAILRGGCVTGGAFYDATQFPPEYRGNFFFGDYNSGKFLRAVIDPLTNGIITFDLWGTGLPTVVGTRLGPDGALYTIERSTSTVQRIEYKATTQALVVSPTNLWMAEGQPAMASIRLALPPAVPALEVQVTRAGGDSDIGVLAGGTLTFTADNWRTPQPVTIAAARDLDGIDDLATISVTAPDLPPEAITVHARDDNGLALVVSGASLALEEGKSGTFAVTLSRQPSLDVVVSAGRVSGDTDIAVTAGATLTFTTSNWSTPQSVTVSVTQDPDGSRDEAVIAVSSAGMATKMVSVTASDDDARAPVITSSPVTRAVAGAPYRYQIVAIGLPAPIFALESAPAGMTVDASTGIVTWTPPAPGSFMATARVSNGVLPDATQALTIDVAADQPPACTLLRPQQGETLSGAMAAFSGDATDDVGIVRVEFQVDGALAYSDMAAAGPYYLGGAPNQWDTTKLKDGPHTARLTAFDTAGQTCAKEVSIVVANGVALPPPDAAPAVADGGIDAGPALADAGTGDGAITAPAATGGDSGCGCHVGRAADEGRSAAFAIAIALLAIGRRRRRLG
jgi:MYXO-CTERM domain-containing protein